MGSAGIAQVMREPGTQDGEDMTPPSPTALRWPRQPPLLDDRASEGSGSRFPLRAPVTAWKLMIHVPGRLRLSNKVVVCFPLQSLCIFILAAAAAAGPGEVMLAEAKKEAQREGCGEAMVRVGLGMGCFWPQ